MYYNQQLNVLLNKIVSFPFGYCSFKSVENHLITCGAKRRLPENPQGIITFLFPYKLEKMKRNISQYALFEDYHIIVMKYLNKIKKQLESTYSNNTFSVFVDNSPIPEVRTANLSGLGVIGNNGLLIHKKYGSFVFIGEIVTDLPLETTYSSDEKCLNCHKCEKVCSGKALDKGKLNKNLCASYLSQKKGFLSENESNILLKSQSVWGCDLCQDICPLNKLIPITEIKEFTEKIVPIIHIGDYKKLSNRAFQWRKAEVIERNISLICINEKI